jgi:3-oxoacyl-[acyl-carrier-protein] synthase I
LNSSVYIAAHHILSPLGFDTQSNFEQLKAMQTGIKKWDDKSLSPQPLMAAKIDEREIQNHFSPLSNSKKYTKLEQLLIISIDSALKQNKEINAKAADTLLIISTTKGNIDLLANPAGFDKERVYLSEAAKAVANYFSMTTTPLVVSNACISGILAMIVAKRLLNQKVYNNVIVAGADLLTGFVVSGFQSFKAISENIAKPYDASRDGISLGEAAGTVILTSQKENAFLNAAGEGFELCGGASSNDANHISGPSRTGDGLLLAINNAIAESEIATNQIDFISGHGTATVFNDEMEALALTDAQLAQVPLHSLKSYFGHTLGAAGIVESVIGLESLNQNTLIGTYNYAECGTSKPVNVIPVTQSKQINVFLKTAAGFGGCNAAAVFKKIKWNK